MAPNSAIKRARAATALATNVVGEFASQPVVASVSSLMAGYHPVIASLVGLASAVTLSQVGQVVSIFGKITKGVNSLWPSATPSPGTQQSFTYDAEQAKKRQYPWTILITLASIVCLAKGRTRVHRTRYVIHPRSWGMAVLTALLARFIGVVVWNRIKSPIGASVATKFITASSVKPLVSSSQLRQVFNATPLVRCGPTKNHTHGQSAADRNAGSSTAALVSRSIGLEPYFIQQSLSDCRKKRDGDRSYHWAKDLAVPPSDFHFNPSDQAAVLVDVDYYIDMPNLLARYPGTYFISAFQPTATAESCGEYNFRFEQDGKVLYRVSGGAEYKHLVWDYRGDTILVEDVGVLTKTIVSYHIDRKYIDDHHVLIMLTVIGSFSAPTVLPTDSVLEGGRLGRLNPVCGNHVVLDVVKPEGLFRSVSISGDHIAVVLPKAQMDAIHAVASVAKVPITPAMVASNVAPSGPSGLPTEKMAPGHAAVLASFIRAGVPVSPAVVYPPSECMVPVYFAKHDYDAPVPLTGFGSPLIGPCYGHATSIHSDDRCIAGRVEAFSSSRQTNLPPSVAGYMVEFAERMIPVAHQGHPLGLDDVAARQDRPSQRSILDEASVSGPYYKKLWRAFVKKETAQKITDPRNISQATPQAKLAYSSLMYAFHDAVMSAQEWYAFNKTPAECAQKVCEILAEASHAVPSDAGRFDGHVKLLARILERLLMLRFFAKQHHAAVNEAMDEQVGLPGTTAEGRKYQSAYTRASGSAETSDMNSINTAFIGYCGWRNTTINGVKCSADVAWSKMGIYGGDDSLEGAIDPKALARSAVIMGQEYKTKVILRGQVGVEFLNRQFGPDVWNGDVNSMAHPSRLLAKLWVGPTHLRNPLERFAERVSGYYRMDRNSPVIGPICLLAHELLGERLEGELMPWDGRHSLDTNWPNEDSGWMDELFDQFIPDFDRARFNNWILSVYQSGDAMNLLRAPLCTSAPESPPAIAISCVYGDSIRLVEPVIVGDVEVGALPDQEELPELLPLEVETAAAVVPNLKKSGLKKDGLNPISKKNEGMKNRPDLWVPPKGKTGAQLQDWLKMRANVCKKRGLPVPE